MEKWTVTEYDSCVIFPYHTDVEQGEYEVIPRSTFEQKYPKTWSYLKTNKDRLLDRSDVDEMAWWGYPYPKNLEKFESPKLLTQVLANEASLALDTDGQFAFVGGGTAGGYGITADEELLSYPALLALLNSSLLDWMLKKESSQFRGGYYSYAKRYLEILPICDDVLYEPVSNHSSHQLVTDSGTLEEGLATLTKEIISVVSQQRAINTFLPDYLGNYEWGQELSKLPSYQPAPGVNSSIVVETEEERENLRIGDCKVVADDSKVRIEVTARYKPKDESNHETDRWGYTETQFIPVMEFVGLDGQMKELISEFVPYVIEQGDGFADFRETATKTNSLLDRLGKIMLPRFDDISQGLNQYLQAKNKSESLHTRQIQAEDAIDDIVYSAYNINKEDRSIIEKSLQNT